MTPTDPAPAEVPPILDAQQFRELARRPDARVIDVRWALDGSKGRHTYLAGHIPGAVYADLGSDLAAPASREAGRHPLPSPEDFAAAMSRLGIANGTVVLAYDDTDGSQAARLVWMLRAVGTPAGLLDGGLGAWLEDGGEDGSPGSAGRSVRVTQDDVIPPRARFAPTPWGPEAIATIDETEAAGRSAGAVVIDARAGERYRGEMEPMDARAGHVPGAVNAPFTGNLGQDGRFLPPAALRERFAAVGVREGADVIVYCGSGVTAAHDLLALERAGVHGARLFPGSWSQWSADESREVATGPEA